MKRQEHKTIRLKDYRPTPYLIDTVKLTFDLHETETRVASEMRVRRNPDYKQETAGLELDGEMIELRAVSINGNQLSETEFRVSEGKLVIVKVPREAFDLQIENTCNPSANTQLTGLYMSNGIYCTQCEAEGFRRITYFYDRPDVMTKFNVRIEAEKSMPILLSNGNPSAHGEIEGGQRHFAEWDDPHPKPSYLFALVAGDLVGVHDSFTTSEGRKVKLGIYVERGKEDRCAWAMQSLKASMRWDEERFGRAYDLDVFNIVAVSDFNMGAMENKGLNIFNDKYILARPDTATDWDFENIEAIIAHEYFHNWTGDRITCRDWFQLCLKEGLTVFRDQEFTSDQRSRAVKRIEDVQDLRARQFPEDRGPLQHPVRPESYIEINNFYTATVYEKGAELCRMMLTLLGAKNFNKAMTLYFKRHDGEAATVEDFVKCMGDASGRDMKQFFRWYNQAGTPRVTVNAKYNAKARRLDIEVAQKTLRLKGQKEKLPLHMPLNVGLIGAHGKDLPLKLKGKGKLKRPMIELTTAKQTFSFLDVSERPVLSLNRGFSAPVLLQHNASTADLLFQMAHDSDSFNRWEAAQALGKNLIGASYSAVLKQGEPPALDDFAAALGASLEDAELDSAFRAKMLSLPVYEELAGEINKDVNSDALFAAREHVRKSVAGHILDQLKEVFARTRDTGAYRPHAEDIGKRALHFACLGLGSGADEAWAADETRHAFEAASNMTAEISSLDIAVRLDRPEGPAMLNQFYGRHADDPLLIDKWFATQATIPGNRSAARVRLLMSHKDFTLKTPNRVYALLRSFIAGNFTGFHASDGAGYKLAADAILQLDSINPQVASRLATGFRSWRLYDSERRVHAQSEMKRILEAAALSRDVDEIISRTLQT